MSILTAGSYIMADAREGTAVMNRNKRVMTSGSVYKGNNLGVVSSSRRERNIYVLKYIGRYLQKDP